MRYGSVCSGIEAATVAWHPLGWTPAFFSEIDAAPRAVLSHHYPTVPLHGDFTTIEAGQYEPIDLLVGGTPCQDFSVAGLRAGIAGERGNLTLEFVRLVGRLRPEWVVWENVPGVLSIDGGRALGAFLGGLAELGYGFAYRILDAQYFGVPQRRRRVFVVGHLGDWRRAAAVLLERESLSGNPPPRREAGEGATHDIAPSIGASGRGFERAGETRGVNAHGGPHGRQDFESETFIAHALRAEGFDASEDGTGRGTPLVPVAFAQNSRDEVRHLGGDGQLVGALSAEPGMKQQTYIAFSSKDHGADSGDLAPTLRAMGHAGSHPNSGGQVAVAFNLRGRDGGSMPEDAGDLASMRAASGGSSRSYIAASAVRRLTPRECERLQGFPDDYTLVMRRGKPMADGPRYKMLGNSMAVPCMAWIGQRIDMVTRLTAAKTAA